MHIFISLPLRRRRNARYSASRDATCPGRCDARAAALSGAAPRRSGERVGIYISRYLAPAVLVSGREKANFLPAGPDAFNSDKQRGRARLRYVIFFQRSRISGIVCAICIVCPSPPPPKCLSDRDRNRK